MKKYNYKTQDGQIIQSDTPINDKNLTLVVAVRGGVLKNVNQK